MLARDCRALIAQYRRGLEAQLQRREARQEMEMLWETDQVFARYPSVEELCALVRPGNGNYGDKDAILSALLVEIKRKPTLFHLLNVMFWPSLLNIFWRKQRIVLNPADLFSRIQVDFYYTAFTYPLERRPRKIDVNLILDTKKKVTAWQRKESQHYERYKPLEPAHGLGTVPADVQESESFPEDIEHDLRDLVYRQVISEKELDLLLETKVYGRMSQQEWAEARGVPHATVRSWCRRAEQRIREYAEDARKKRDRLDSADWASPS